jgi:hypothetical protein
MNLGRILDRLTAAELAESNVWFRQDYRQAFICLSSARRGEAAPFIASSYRIYGTHPDLVWSKIMANRRAKLGKEMNEWYDAAGNLTPDLPKKKPTIYIDEQAEQATRHRLAALLMFPAKGVQHANLEQTGSARKPKTRRGTLYEMPQAARSPEHQPLRILPA